MRRKGKEGERENGLLASGVKVVEAIEWKSRATNSPNRTQKKEREHRLAERERERRYILLECGRL